MEGEIYPKETQGYLPDGWDGLFEDLGNFAGSGVMDMV